MFDTITDHIPRILTIRRPIPYVCSSDGHSNITCDVPITTPAIGDHAGAVLLSDDLTVRATVSCKGTYALTANDINALETSSMTSVQGSDTFNNTVHDNDSESVSLHQVSYTKEALPETTCVPPGVVASSRNRLVLRHCLCQHYP